MNSNERYLETLRSVWGYENFRGIQLSIIQSIGEGKDTLGLMPTGGGKSITFQVPALCMTGTCLVITPLIALMKDQIRELRAKGIRAAAIHSDMTHEQCVIALDNCILGNYKFLYVSPERLSSPFFLKKIKHLQLSFITVDEAHCICQWGYDFRPSYTHIADFRAECHDVPILALTATATPEVARDIQKQLNFPTPNVFRMSFHRPNLSYYIRRTDIKIESLKHLLESTEGSVIIYLRNRLKCESLAEQLTKSGLSANAYHAGLKAWVKDERQESWLKGETRIIVATNAFGMGINKPDVRLVVHMDLPDSLEEYFQEAGRAGRDGEKAYSVIFIDGNELKYLKRRVEQSYPPIEYVQKVYECLCFFCQLAMGDGMNVTRELNMEQFYRTYGLQPQMTWSSLILLSRAGYIDFEDEDESISRLHITATRNFFLENLTDDEHVLFLNVFRNYGGIFVDYVFIDEALISHETGLAPDFIHHSLTELDKRKLLKYIPKKHTPKVTFRQRRVEKEDIVLPKHLYSTRKKAYKERIQAIFDYCTCTDRCRSQILLEYFGERLNTVCHICDVCEEELQYKVSTDDYQAIRANIIRQLSKGPRRPSDVDCTHIHPDKLWNTLNIMYDKEEIRMQDFLIYLNVPPTE